MKQSSSKKNAIYELDGRPSFAQAFPLGFQQLLAMFVGNIVPMILVANAAEMDSYHATLLIQCCVLGAGVATLIQAFPIKLGKIRIGSGLPVMMGLTYTFLPICLAVATNGELGLPVLFGAQLVAALSSVFVAFVLPYIRKFFPPIVTGTIIVSIGISCFSIAAYNLAGGQGASDLGQPHNWIIGAVVILVIVGCTSFGKGMVNAAAVLIGIVAGYVIAAVVTLAGIVPVIDFSSIGAAKWFAIPQPLAFGNGGAPLAFNPTIILVFILLYFINAVEMVGDMTVSATGGLSRQPKDEELSGGILGNAVGCMFASVFNCFATGSYSQCSGIVAMTKVCSRWVMGTGAMTLIVAAFCPKLAAVLSTIPNCVVGGATMVVFSMITMSGMSLVAKSRFTSRSMLICGISLTLGLGISFAKDTLDVVGGYVQMFFGESSIILVALTAIVLNIVLPKTREDLNAEASID